MRLVLLFVLAAPALAVGQDPDAYDEPIARARARVEARERAHGPRHAATATALVDLGRALFEAQRIAEATRTFARALAIREKLAPEGDAAVGEALQLLGTARLQAGDHERAAPLLERALVLHERWLGPEHPEVAVTSLNLARVSRQRGQLEVAEAQSRRALAILAPSSAPEHPLALSARQMLGGILVDQGRIEEARHELEAALAAAQARHGHSSLVVANLHRSLSQVLGKQDLVGLAIEHAERALGILEPALGADATAVALARIALGNVLGQAERWLEAEPHYRQAWATLSGRPEPFPGLHVHLLSNLAVTLRMLGIREEAGTLAHQVVDLCRQGTAPPQEIATSLGKAGAVLLEVEGTPAAERVVEVALERVGDRFGERLRWSMVLAVAKIWRGDAEAALPLLRRCIEDAQAVLAAGAPVFAERTRLLWAESGHLALQALVGLTGASQAGEVHGYVAAWKNQVARGLLERRDWLRQHASPEARAVLERLASIHARTSTWRGAAGDQAALHAQRERLELELSRHFRPEPVRPWRPPELEPLVGSGEALVDYVVWNRDALRDELVPGPASLSAFVVTPDGTTRVDLGRLPPILEAVAAHHLVTSRRVRPFTSPAARRHADAVARRLRELLWEPLDAAIGSARRVVICPDGPIALVPFETLPGERGGTFLIENLELRYLQSPLEIAARAAPAGRGPVLLLGDVDYRGVELGLRLPRLPATAAEIDGLARLARSQGSTVELLTGTSANEAAFRRLAPGATFVHLATHGFAGAALPGRTATAAMLELLSPRQSDPRLLGAQSGLVVARGAPGAEDDGILTSDDLCWLDLAACELFCLSACDTGLAPAMAGEHLLGVRRSLRLAGARATLTALWQVPDAATRDLMLELYRRIWQDGAAKAVALRGAQLAMIARNRGRTGDALPGTWGGFVLEGR